ncbi:MAG: TIGR02300 family protein [Rhodospirillales bacterium]
MVKPDWGKKLTCPSCGAKFYDLKKDPATCPKCETQVEAQPILKPRRQPAEAPKPKKEAKPAKEKGNGDDTLLDGDDDDLELESDEADLMEDTSELEEDEDDVSEVKEHIEVENDEDR